MRSQLRPTRYGVERSPSVPQKELPNSGFGDSPLPTERTRPLDLELPIRPAFDDRVRAAIRRARAVRVTGRTPLPRRLLELPHTSKGAGGWTVRQVLARLREASSPTIDFLKRAGAGILGDPERWEAHRLGENEKAREREESERAAEVARYDTWLRNLLDNGPVPLSVVRARAEEEGMRWGNSVEYKGWATVSQSATRLKVFTVVPEAERESAEAHWTLKGWEGFIVPPATYSSSAQAAGMR